MKVSLKNRLGWIEAFLRYSGSFDSRDKMIYREMFGVSAATVSGDQQTFMDRLDFDSGVPIDSSGGKLRICPADPDSIPASAKLLPFEPVFNAPGLHDWLSACLGKSFERCHAARRRDPSPEIVREIVAAIGLRRIVSIDYASRKGGPSSRSISPHAIVDIAGRLHVRAYDHDKIRFSDFVMTRIQSCGITGREGYVPAHEDKEWLRKTRIEISIKEGEDHLATKLDYGFDEVGSRVELVRQALAGYLIDNPAAAYSSPVLIREVSPKG